MTPVLPSVHDDLDNEALSQLTGKPALCKNKQRNKQKQKKKQE